jgi:hypothetical protein
MPKILTGKKKPPQWAALVGALLKAGLSLDQFEASGLASWSGRKKLLPKPVGGNTSVHQEF